MSPEGGSGEDHLPRVKRRTVFYIEGYDPRGPSHYHALYRDEAARQAPVNGLAITVGPRRKLDSISSGWRVSSPQAETQYVFLRYDDIMRGRWAKTGPAVLRDICRYASAYLRRGVYAAMFRHSRPLLFFTTLAPALVVIGLIVSALAGTALGFLVNGMAGLAAAVAMLAGLVALQPVFEPRVAAFWLARICAFTADLADGIPAMEGRIDAFAARIAAAAMEGDADEVLVVGHSVGSFIGVSACARALARMGGAPARISFLTLGQSIPMYGVQPDARAFRAELQQLAADRRVTWIDVSAPSDGLCFALTDPVMASGLKQPVPAQQKPRLMPARYVRLFTPPAYAAMTRDFYRHHFQYLMAAELPGEYDYFLITGGGMSLAERYAPGSGSAGAGHPKAARR